MVSLTKQTTRRRGLRASQRGRWNKKHGKTPVFPVHPDGYDAKAADAKPVPAVPAPVADAKKAAPGA